MSSQQNPLDEPGKSNEPDDLFVRDVIIEGQHLRDLLLKRSELYTTTNPWLCLQMRNAAAYCDSMVSELKIAKVNLGVTPKPMDQSQTGTA